VVTLQGDQRGPPRRATLARPAPTRTVIRLKALPSRMSPRPQRSTTKISPTNRSRTRCRASHVGSPEVRFTGVRLLSRRSLGCSR